LARSFVEEAKQSGTVQHAINCAGVKGIVVGN
jgi:hypothetical protein